MTTTDRADLTRLIAWYIARRDHTPTADRPDPDTDAAEIVAAMHTRGWRRTEAQPTPPWAPRGSSAPATPDAVRQHAAAARAALAGQTEETDTDA